MQVCSFALTRVFPETENRWRTSVWPHGHDRQLLSRAIRKFSALCRSPRSILQFSTVTVRNVSWSECHSMVRLDHSMVRLDLQLSSPPNCTFFVQTFCQNTKIMSGYFQKLTGKCPVSRHYLKTACAVWFCRGGAQVHEHCWLVYGAAYNSTFHLMLYVCKCMTHNV